jgi:coproporphyrinogen III oxidase-like Fe-S oxidoreductase
MADSLKVIKPEPATSHIEAKTTEVGSVFVSNYPPYSFWSKESVPKALEALHSRPNPDETLGLYLHIPFCRKRCKFCYFRVYTDKNSDEIQVYLRGLSKEVSLYGKLPSVQDRPLKFVYFGGGTPSYISAKHLRYLVKDLRNSIPWKGAEEITFECEPGTLTEAKLDAIKEIGVTRLSLGIENFNDTILEENGRAHHSQEIFRVLPWIRKRKFDQLNIDLIAGMLGEKWGTWRDSVQKTIEIDPDSVTIYQMELPYNTVFSGDLLSGKLNIPVADWETKRAWHQYAFEQLSTAGYIVSSAYTMVKKDKKCNFVYRNAVWHGSDMIGTGVASFSHMTGVHFQNYAGWEQYLASLQSEQLPLDRAFSTSKQERLTREMILQLKLGYIHADYFRIKFGADLAAEFGEDYSRLKENGFLTFDSNKVQLTPKGLLQVDQLLPEFYDLKYRNSRYT